MDVRIRVPQFKIPKLFSFFRTSSGIKINIFSSLWWDDQMNSQSVNWWTIWHTACPSAHGEKSGALDVACPIEATSVWSRQSWVFDTTSLLDASRSCAFSGCSVSSIFWTCSVICHSVQRDWSNSGLLLLVSLQLANNCKRVHLTRVETWSEKKTHIKTTEKKDDMTSWHLTLVHHDMSNVPFRTTQFNSICFRHMHFFMCLQRYFDLDFFFLIWRNRTVPRLANDHTTRACIPSAKRPWLVREGSQEQWKLWTLLVPEGTVQLRWTTSRPLQQQAPRMGSKGESEGHFGPRKEENVSPKKTVPVHIKKINQHALKTNVMISRVDNEPVVKDDMIWVKKTRLKSRKVFWNLSTKSSVLLEVWKTISNWFTQKNVISCPTSMTSFAHSMDSFVIVTLPGLHDHRISMESVIGQSCWQSPDFVDDVDLWCVSTELILVSI